MTFFSGNDNNAQWVALTFNLLNIFYSFYQTRDKSNGSFGIFTYWLRVILAIAFIAIYYIVRSFKFKDGNEDWNTVYFIASIVLLFLKGV